MKAIVITAPGPAEVLKLVKRPVPEIKSTQVLIKVYAAGLNYLDVLQRKGKYPVPEGVPADILGLDVAGEIVACGSEVRRWKPGHKVCALLNGAGYAEFAAADEGLCLPLPSTISYAEAASLPEAIFTVWHNVFQRGKLKHGESFLVHGGSGGIGITAIQLARLYGAQVFATAGSENKCQACTDLGAVACINYKTQDFEHELRDTGVDLVLDMIGEDYVQKNINIMNSEGRLVYINAQSSKLQANIFSMMQKRITITGSTLRSRDVNFKAELAAEVEKEVWPLVEKSLFKPVIHKVYKFEEAVQAHRAMEAGEHIGKIILGLGSA